MATNNTSNIKAGTAPEQIAAMEWLTLLLILGTYGGWFAMTYAYRTWPLAVVAPAVAVLITLQCSLQHEILHGHPTRDTGFNKYLGMLSLTLWLPFVRYRDAHLVHHHDERITDPIDDPESFYWRPEDWRRLNPLVRAVLWAMQTLAGRFLIGSSWFIGAYLIAEMRGVRRNDAGLRRTWIVHLFWCLPALLWLTTVCGMPIWLYVVAMVIPSYGLLLTRSFAEHRARDAVRERIAIVERSWILGPLFLFNNLHALHHETPWLPWYRYGARYRLHRDRLIADNGGLIYRTYFDVARRFLLHPHDTPQHPTGRAPTPSAQAGLS